MSLLKNLRLSNSMGTLGIRTGGGRRGVLFSHFLFLGSLFQDEESHSIRGRLAHYSKGIWRHGTRVIVKSLHLVTPFSFGSLTTSAAPSQNFKPPSLFHNVCGLWEMVANGLGRVFKFVQIFKRSAQFSV